MKVKIVNVLDESILKAYIKAATSRRVAFSFFLFYVLGISFLFALAPRVVANNDNILNKGKELVDDLATSIRVVSTGAALVGVGTGAFLKKFSLGKPDRIETGNKMITNSIWAWVIVNGLLLILRFFGSYFGLGDVTDEWNSGQMPTAG